MKTELELLTDKQLLTEIKRQWYEIASIEWDASEHDEKLSIADDYMMSDIEEHIDTLEKEYKSRGLELPDRGEYVAQFTPDDESE